CCGTRRMSSNVRASESPASIWAAAPSGSAIVWSSVLVGYCPWHFLNFLPLPHQHGSFRPIFGSSRRTVLTGASSPPVRAGRGATAVAVCAPALAEPPLRVTGIEGRRGGGGGAGTSPDGPSLETMGRSRHR